MNRIETAIEIEATPQEVWEVLTEFDAYPEWNPWMVIRGRPTEGARLLVAPGPQAGRMPTFRPVVQRVDPPHEFVWVGHLWMSGLFDGEHRFVILDTGDGTSRLVQSERFSGIFSRPILRLVRHKTEAGFHEMNRALKDRVEWTALTASAGPLQSHA